MDHALIYITLAAFFGLFMAWGIGANDVANAMATSIGSRAITVKQAVIIAAIFEFSGAVLAGGEVTKTIRKGIIDTDALSNPEILVMGMLAALLAAGVWLLIASWLVSFWAVVSASPYWTTLCISKIPLPIAAPTPIST